MQASPHQPPAEKGVLKKSIRSGQWLAFGYIVQKAINTISFFVLARLLTPADFGVMAIVLLVPKMANSSTELGFSTAAVQRGGDIKHYLNPIWTINVLKAFGISLFVVAIAPFIAHYLHADHAYQAIALGGIFIVIYNFSNVGEVFFFKNLEFKKIFFRNTIRDGAYALTAIVGALLTHSYWALFAATLASYSAQTISTYILHPYRPKLSFHWQPLRELFNYSKWVVGQGWLDQANAFIEQSAIARFTGVAATGLYSKAKSVASVAPGFLNPAINTISFSAYAQLKEAAPKLKDGFIKSLDLIFFFLIPVMLLIFVGGETLVSLALGNQWTAMTDTLRVFLIFYLISGVNDLCSTLLNAIGYPDREVKFNLFKVILTGILIIPLTRWYGIVGGASALVISIIPSTFLNIRSITKLTPITMRDTLQPILLPALLSTLLVIPALQWKEPLLHLSPPLLILCVGGAGLIYVTLTMIIGESIKLGPYKTLKTILTHFW